MCQKLENENENLIAKYEKKINLLTLENNESTLRVKKLINTCISLKDYALNAERNINNSKYGIGSINNSMIIPNTGLNMNSTFQGGKFPNTIFQNLKGNEINKILNEDELNQTY